MATKLPYQAVLDQIDLRVGEIRVMQAEDAVKLAKRREKIMDRIMELRLMIIEATLDPEMLEEPEKPGEPDLPPTGVLEEPGGPAGPSEGPKE